MDGYIALIGAICTTIGVLLTKMTDWLKVWSKTTIDQEKQDLSEADKALEIYREIVSDLRAEMKDLARHLDAQDEQHARCREENARLLSEVNALKERVRALEARGM